jgi:hypothetical protein
MPVDRYGDSIPGGGVARMGSTRYRQAAPYTALVFSRNGKSLASAGQDAILRIWEVATGKEDRQFGIYETAVQALAWSPDAKLLVSGGHDGSLSFWDVASGNDLRQVQGHPGGVLTLAFTPDGATLLSAGADNVVRLWDPNSGEALGEMAGNFGTFEVVAFAPDNTTIVLGSWESTLRLCDLASGAEVRQFRGPRVGVKSLASSPDGRTLATGSIDGSVGIWELITGKERRQFPKHLDGAFAVTFSVDGRLLASSGADTTILVWDVTSQLQEKVPGAVLLPAQLPPLWDELADDDPLKANRAMRALAVAPEVSLPFVKDRLNRLATPDARDVSRWIAELGDGQLFVRERATQELEKRGALVEPALQTAQAARPPLEARRRLERLLAKLAEPVPPTLVLQGLRALETLEMMPTPAAVQALEALGRSMPETRLSRDAAAAARRQRGSA